MYAPVTSYHSRNNKAAATEESTPPLMATNTFSFERLFMVQYDTSMLAVSLTIAFLTSIIELLGEGRGVVVIPYATVVPLLLILPRLIYTVKKASLSAQWLSRMERLSFFAMLLNAPGSLYFHEAGFGYDRFLHFAVGIIAPQMFLLLALPFLSTPISKSKALTVLAFFSFISLFLWEGFQFSIDQLFGTHLFFDVHQVIQVDFWEDIIFGGIGVALSLFYLHIRLDKILSLAKPRSLITDH